MIKARGVTHPVKDLKGFQKVWLKKGGNLKTEIEVDVDDLAFYDESVSGWNLEKGEYIIYIGNASDKIAQEIKIDIR